MLLCFEICLITMCGPAYSVIPHIIAQKEQILTTCSVITQCGSSTEVLSLLENVDCHCT